MLFNSFVFLVFFSVVFISYWLLSKKTKAQNVLLLLSSYVFYGWWDWRFLSLIIFSSIVDYFIGHKINESLTQVLKKRWLIGSLVSNLGLLAVFKYFNFFADSFYDLASIVGWQPNQLTLSIILPVGISFYTFQTMSYSIDIYRAKIKPTKSILSFFTYVAFFPQLVAGPIERAANLIPQIETPRIFKKEDFNAGVVQIFVGLFRKIVIADSLGVYVDNVYQGVDVFNGTDIFIATVFYAFQIYFDFSGYSDIAIGTARLLGFKFNQNFNLPYFSSSLTKFWRRWHMSLSFWLRDYLYISLGGNRKGIKITYRNLLLTMLLGGLWHGSSWNFVIWGGIHGVVLSIERYFNQIKFLLPLRKLKPIGFLFTFFVVIIAWIFFRAVDLKTALIATKKILTFDFGMPYINDISVFINALFLLFLGVCFDLFLFANNIKLENFGLKMNVLGVSLFCSIMVIILALFYSTSENFIYFQF